MFYRLQGDVSTPLGIAIAGVSVAVLTQPAVTTSTPGSPLAQLYSGPTSNSTTITGASWSGQQITFIFASTPPADVVEGSYISVTGAAPSGYNGTWLVVEVSGTNVIVTAITNRHAATKVWDIEVSTICGTIGGAYNRKEARIGGL